MDKFYHILFQWMLAWTTMYSFGVQSWSINKWECYCYMKGWCRKTCNAERDSTCPEQNIDTDPCDLDLKPLLLVEGDISYKHPLEFVQLFGAAGSLDQDNAWPDRVIPYQISTAFNESESNSILTAMNILMKKTSFCLLFCDRTTEEKCKTNLDYVYIDKKEGCYSPVGRTGEGKQILSLAPKCFTQIGTILHELMHAIGFEHEHNRNDRDSKIEVFRENIAPGKIGNFQKRDIMLGYEENVEYDYYSVMHYSLYAFARQEGLQTLNPRLSGQIDNSQIGQRTGLSEGDVRKINLKYRCETKKCEKPPPLSNGDQHHNSLFVGSTVTHTCNNNYITFGAKFRQCRYDGTWSGLQPYCFKKEDYHEATCTFDKEEDICGWRNEGWIQTRLPTPTEGTGPEGDETEWGTNLGQYLYLESSSPAKENDTAVLKYDFSETCDPEQDHCISLWYNMYGDQYMGTLRIVSQIHQSEEKTTVWQKSGNQGRGWKYITKCFERCSPITISIEAVRGKSFRSDIAIDNILVAKRNIMRNYCLELSSSKDIDIRCDDVL